MRSAFNLNKKLDVKGNHRMMGFVVNSLLLAYKNKPDFLSKLVMTANPSLISMYNVIRRLAKESGYRPPEEVQSDKESYVEQQRADIKVVKKLSELAGLRSGQSAKVGNIVYQYGGGVMFKGKQYDRYTVFKIHPDADFLVIIWPMGLVQASASPFKKTKDVHIGKIFNKLLNGKYKEKLNKNLTLYDMKEMFEKEIKDKKDSLGYTFDALINTFKQDQVKGIDIQSTGRWSEIVRDIMNKNIRDLSPKQKDLLKKISVNLWDIVMSEAGGHKSISSVPRWEFYGRGYIDLMKEFAVDVIKELNG